MLMLGWDTCCFEQQRAAYLRYAVPNLTFQPILGGAKCG